MNVLLPSVAALVAVLLVPGLSFYFDVTPKVAIVLLGAAAALWGSRAPLSRSWPAVRTRTLNWFFVALAIQAAAILLAAAFSTHRWFSIYGTTWRRSGAFAELAVLALAATAAGRLASDPKPLRMWLRITVLAAAPVSLYAILQYFGIDPLLDPAAYRFGEGRFMIVRPPGTLGHASYLATYLLYPVFGGVALARMEKARAWKFAALIASGLALFAIVLSGTRAALLGFLAGAIFVAARRLLDRKWLAAAAGIVAAVAIFYISPAGAQLRARVFWSSEDMLGGSRLWLWRDTLRMSARRPIAGYGPETFSLEFPRNESLELAAKYPDFYHESPHNIFLDALVSQGIFGLAALALVVAIGIAAARGAIGAAFIAILLSQQFTAFTLPTELYFYLSLALLTCGAGFEAAADFQSANGSHRRTPRDQASVANVRERFTSGFLRPLAIPFACFAIYLTAGDFLLGAARRALDRGDVESAARLVDGARQWRASADSYFSRRFLLAKASDAATRAAESAVTTADDPQNALLNLAAFRAISNDAPGVEQALRQAISIVPNWYKPHWLLAQVLEKEGRIAQAAAEAQTADDRSGGKIPEVTDTWTRLRSTVNQR